MPRARELESLPAAEVSGSPDDRPTPESLFRQHYVRLSRTAQLLVDDPRLAEEIVQDAFAELVARWAGIDPDRAVGYLYRTVTNAGRSTLRRRRLARAVIPDIAAPVPGVDVDVLRQSQDGLIWHAVTRLPRRQRQVVVLRFYSDMSVPEVASVLRITSSAVAMATRHALQALRAVRKDLT